MAIRIQPLPVSAPGLHAFRWSSDERYTAMKESYAIGRVERGRSSFVLRGKVWDSAPGALHLRQPGDVHRDVAHDGPVSMAVVAFPASVVERIAGKVRVHPVLAPGDPRGAAFERLHDAIVAGADRLALEVAVAEALAALAAAGDAERTETRPVRRALDLLRARLGEAITLDDLATHAGLDKYHLCRAFRAQVGMPPHAYLTHLRVARAKELLAAGTRPRDVAPLVGLYDQSQLNRHFRRIVGTTPGRYARSV
ncbi:MAG: AraC family transcriptional regulator [Minicystis sp.]